MFFTDYSPGMPVAQRNFRNVAARELRERFEARNCDSCTGFRGIAGEKMKKYFLFTSAALALLFASSSTSHPWNGRGHMMVQPKQHWDFHQPERRIDNSPGCRYSTDQKKDCLNFLYVYCGHRQCREAFVAPWIRFMSSAVGIEGIRKASLTIQGRLYVDRPGTHRGKRT